MKKVIAARVAPLCVASVAAWLICAAPAGAFTGSPVWTCRSSAVWASVSGNNRVEPIVANGNPSTANSTSPDFEQCADANVGENNLATPLAIPLQTVTADTASAITSVTPQLGTSAAQTASASATVENLGLLFNVSGTALPAIGVKAATSSATAKCVAGSSTPQITLSKNVATLTLGGQPIDLDPLVTDLANALKPLGFLITITPNEQFTDPVNGDTGVRALHIEVVPTSGGTPLVNLVVAESEVGGSTNVCNTAATGPPALATPTAQLPAGYGSFTGGQANQGVLGNGDVGTANSGIHPTCGKLSMHFVKAGKTIVHPTHSLTSHYGKRDVIRGTIVTCSKHPQPIVNAKIDQIHIFAGKKLIKTGLKSRPHGRLTLILPDNLTSRSILFQYRPNLNSSKVSSSVTLHLKVVR